MPRDRARKLDTHMFIMLCAHSSGRLGLGLARRLRSPAKVKAPPGAFLIRTCNPDLSYRSVSGHPFRGSTLVVRTRPAGRVHTSIVLLQYVARAQEQSRELQL